MADAGDLGSPSERSAGSSPVKLIMKDKLLEDWKYNEQTDAWVFGKDSDGGGVFKDSSLKNRGHECWTGNAVFGSNVVNVGDFNSRGQAQLMVESKLAEMRRNQ